MAQLRSSTAGMIRPLSSAFPRGLIFHLTSNPYFPEPLAAGLSLLICIALGDKHDSWIVAGSRGDRENIATRDKVAVEVQNLLDKLAHYVEMTAGDNLATLRSRPPSGHKKSPLRRDGFPLSYPIASTLNGACLRLSPG